MSEDLGSQRYGWQLVRNAMKRQSVIVVMRSKRLWFGAIPELETYPRIYELRNVQNVTISPGNCPKAWPLIEEILK
jgi:hypothetical protein